MNRADTRTDEGEPLIEPNAAKALSHPGCRVESALNLSAAISLKRIADALEKLTNRGDEQVKK